MFQHTLDRAARLSSWEHIVVVAAAHHQREVWAQLGDRQPGLVLFQPVNQDTAAGVLLPLTHILARDPDATVAIFPSDHFIYPEERFLENVEQALKASDLLEGRPILLAAKPDGLELDYGWILPGKRLPVNGLHDVRAVHSFIEKPPEAQAAMLMASGAQWNTMVVVAKGESLWAVGEQTLPKMMTLFERLKQAIDTPREPETLDTIYGVMPRRNFSTHLLQGAPERLAVMELRDVLWSDWGRPKRIVQMLDRIGKRPAFADADLSALHA
jgi:mannose-1-phosphate guanylyltransferase